jgi:hypothetical protein
MKEQGYSLRNLTPEPVLFSGGHMKSRLFLKEHQISKCSLSMFENPRVNDLVKIGQLSYNLVEC